MVMIMRILWPVRPETAVRIDAKFLDPQYVSWRRRTGLPVAEHTGIDINIAGTHGDGDEGYPVIAFAEGKVVSVSRHRVWGWIILIEHDKVPGYSKLWSQYAHVKFPCVAVGDYVMAGEAIASIGKGDPLAPFLAHLHFEIRKRPVAPDYWPGMNKAEILADYIDPEAYIKQYRDSSWRFLRKNYQLITTNPDTPTGQYIVNLDPAGDKVWIRKTS